jgi:c-di-GMP-binding flagellar brake protein YcgR
MPQTPIDDPNYSTELTRVTDPAQIANLIKRIKDNRALLNVTVRGEPKAFLSAVLDVNPTEGYLLLDELVPKGGHEALLRERRLDIYAQTSGVDISFAGVLLEARVESDGALYRLALPEVLYYRQRREYYRVRVSRGQHIPFVIRDTEGNEIEGSLHDISAGGLGSEFLRATGLSLEQGQVLTDCMLRLLNDMTLNVSVEVRFVSEDAHARTLRLGGRFVDLPAHERKLIEHFVATLDREWRRKLAKE